MSIWKHRHFPTFFVVFAAVLLRFNGFAPGQSRSGVALQDEGRLPYLGGATVWLDSQPLKAADLRGKVVVFNFWTYSCINSIRMLPYLRAWAQKYKSEGLVVVGVQAPEFEFEKSLDNVRWALKDRNLAYPIAVDNDHVLWGAFKNEYWPALYFVDSHGRIRHHQFGEGHYEESERVIQQLLGEAGAVDTPHDLVSVDPSGVELEADWRDMASPESYLGYERAEAFVSSDGLHKDTKHIYSMPGSLEPNQWGLTGAWTVGKEAATLNAPNGRIAYRFHARDLHLILGSVKAGTSVRFRVLIDGMPPADAHGVDTDSQGCGRITEQRMYQLVRQSAPVREHLFEIEFLDAGAQAYDFTFG